MNVTLKFNNIKLYGYHGSHSEESLTGNYFLVNIDAKINSDFMISKPHLSNSVDYETLHKLVKKSFEKRENLIENVALNILCDLKKHFENVSYWKISVSKNNPVGDGSFTPSIVIEE